MTTTSTSAQVKPDKHRQARARQRVAEMPRLSLHGLPPPQSASSHICDPSSPLSVKQAPMSVPSSALPLSGLSS